MKKLFLILTIISFAFVASARDLEKMSLTRMDGPDITLSSSSSTVSSLTETLDITFTDTDNTPQAESRAASFFYADQSDYLFGRGISTEVTHSGSVDMTGGANVKNTGGLTALKSQQSSDSGSTYIWGGFQEIKINTSLGSYTDIEDIIGYEALLSLGSSNDKNHTVKNDMFGFKANFRDDGAIKRISAPACANDATCATADILTVTHAFSNGDIVWLNNTEYTNVSANTLYTVCEISGTTSFKLDTPAGTCVGAACSTCNSARNLVADAAVTGTWITEATDQYNVTDGAGTALFSSFYSVDAPFWGTQDIVTGMWIDPPYIGNTANYGIVIDGSCSPTDATGYGCGIVLGETQDAGMWFDGSILNMGSIGNSVSMGFRATNSGGNLTYAMLDGPNRIFKSYGYDYIAAAANVENGTVVIGSNLSYAGIISYDGATTAHLSIANSYDNVDADIKFFTRTAGTDVEAMRIQGEGAVKFVGGATFPASCEVGDVWMDTDGTIGLCLCTGQGTPGTWSGINYGVGPTTPDCT